MNDTIPVLLQKLESQDRETTENAYLNLLSAGSKAVFPLIQFLDSSKVESARVLAAEAIAKIREPQSADPIFFFLKDRNEQIRSWSAITLRKLGDPRALDALILTIDDHEDLLHNDQTLSTYALIAWGTEVFPKMVDLLNNPNVSIRKRAITVIEGIVHRYFKHVGDWQTIFLENGSYEPTMEESARIQCMKKWNHWIIVNQINK